MEKGAPTLHRPPPLANFPRKMRKLTFSLPSRPPRASVHFVREYARIWFKFETLDEIF